MRLSADEQPAPIAPESGPGTICFVRGSPIRDGAILSKRHFFRYESRNQPLLSRRGFLRRLAVNFTIAVALIGVSLLAGMVGYHYFEGHSWIDAFANAAMILSGMGPLAPLQTWSGKLFAGCYALYSGLVVIVAAGVLFAPVLHRMLHSFHVGTEDGQHDHQPKPPGG